jgi:hypothetical protein
MEGMSASEPFAAMAIMNLVMCNTVSTVQIS